MCRWSGREMLPIKPRGFLLGEGEGEGVGRVTVLTFLDYLCLKNQQERAIVYAFFLFKLDKSTDIDSPSTKLLPLFFLFYAFYKPCSL